MTEGYDLVPILMMHENGKWLPCEHRAASHDYEALTASTVLFLLFSDFYCNPCRDFQMWCYKRTGVPMGLPYYTNSWYLPCSNRKPLRVVIGKRLVVTQSADPTEDEVNEMHRLFYEEIVRCWRKHKREMGFEDRDLTYVM